MLVNNAALAHYKPFAELPAEQAQELVQLNVLAPVMLTRAVLPGMVARGEGAVINVASLLAFSGALGQALPAASARSTRPASRSSSRSRRSSRASCSDSGVRVQVVCPGLVRSEFHTRQGIDMSEVPRMEPDTLVAGRASRSRARRRRLDPRSRRTTRPLREIAAAAEALLPSTRTVELPERYTS